MLRRRNRAAGVAVNDKKGFRGGIASTHGRDATPPTGVSTPAAHAPGSSALCLSLHLIVRRTWAAGIAHARGWPWRLVYKLSDREMVTAPSPEKRESGLVPSSRLRWCGACPGSQEAAQSFVQMDSNSAPKPAEGEYDAGFTGDEWRWQRVV